jgi:hypothetical protein
MHNYNGVRSAERNSELGGCYISGPAKQDINLLRDNWPKPCVQNRGDMVGALSRDLRDATEDGKAVNCRS